MEITQSDIVKFLCGKNIKTLLDNFSEHVIDEYTLKDEVMKQIEIFILNT